MRADPQGRYAPESNSSRRGLVLLASVIVIGAIAAVLWFQRTSTVEKPAPLELQADAPEPSQLAPPEPEPAPDIPEKPESVQPNPAGEEEQQAEAPAPVEQALTLEGSDERVRAKLSAGLSNAAILSALDADNLLSRAAALVDGIARGIIPYKVLPLSPPSAAFRVERAGRQAIMSPAGYQRFDSYALAIDGLDEVKWAKAFHRYRPLLEEAYSLLGYEAEDFDNTVIQALDRIIAAPVREGPIELRRVEAVYKFEDPALERLPEVHRQLLRMGPENTRRLQAKAAALREALLAE